MRIKLNLFRKERKEIPKEWNELETKRKELFNLALEQTKEA
jgi:hypothetical protein